MASSIHSNNLISLLICTRDRRTRLLPLVESLKGIDSNRSFEIIVVEETDAPEPIEGIRYVSHPVADYGIAYARNLSLANAKGEIIVFLDDDCRIHDDWLERLLEPFNDDNVIGVQGGVTVPESANAMGWAESILGFPGGGIRRVLNAKGELQETREISTLNCAYRRWVIEKVGGFDQRLNLGGEDNLLAKQVCNHGRCLFVPAALVSHEARGSLARIWHWFVRRGRAEITLLRTANQKDMNLWTIFRSSLAPKLCLLLMLSLTFSAVALPLIVFSVLAYTLFQYVRYHESCRKSDAPHWALAVLPLVKLTMDAAMDWGRFRGIIFD